MKIITSVRTTRIRGLIPKSRALLHKMVVGYKKRMKKLHKTESICNSDVEALQSNLAFIDLMYSRRSSSSNGIELLLLQRDYIKVRMRPERNHRRPHFHIEYKTEYSATYAVDTLERLAGNMPSRYEQPILQWAQDKKAPLLATWDDLCAGKDVRELVIEIEKERP